MVLGIGILSSLLFEIKFGAIEMSYFSKPSLQIKVMPFSKLTLLKTLRGLKRRNLLIYFIRNRTLL